MQRGTNDPQMLARVARLSRLIRERIAVQDLAESRGEAQTSSGSFLKRAKEAVLRRARRLR